MLKDCNDFFDARGLKVPKQPKYVDLKKWAQALNDREKWTRGIGIALAVVAGAIIE